MERGAIWVDEAKRGKGRRIEEKESLLRQRRKREMRKATRKLTPQH